MKNLCAKYLLVFGWVVSTLCLFSTPAWSVADPAYDAFLDGRYLTAKEEAEKAAAKGDPAAHTLLGEIYGMTLFNQIDLCPLPHDLQWQVQHAGISM